MFVRSAFNYDVDKASLDAGLFCDPSEGLTLQSFAEEVDINTIVARFGLTGHLPEEVQVPVSGDFTDVVDFQTAMNAVRKAEEGFMELPPNIRARFGHDPQQLMDFVEDGRNYDEALRMGLLKPRPEVTRDMVQAIDELAEKWSSKKE